MFTPQSQIGTIYYSKFDLHGVAKAILNLSFYSFKPFGVDILFAYKTNFQMFPIGLIHLELSDIRINIKQRMEKKAMDDITIGCHQYVIYPANDFSRGRQSTPDTPNGLSSLQTTSAPTSVGARSGWGCSGGPHRYNLVSSGNGVSSSLIATVY